MYFAGELRHLDKQRRARRRSNLPGTICWPDGFAALIKGYSCVRGMITKNPVILIGQIEAERSQGKFDSRITDYVKCKSRAGSRTPPSDSDRKIRSEEAAFSNPNPEQSFASAVGDSPIFD
jgi:hypothetical protein